MRKKSKNFRRDSKTRSTFIVKALVRSDSEIFFIKTGPLKIPSNSKKPLDYYTISTLKKNFYRFEFVSKF